MAFSYRLDEDGNWPEDMPADKDTNGYRNANFLGVSCGGPEYDTGPISEQDPRDQLPRNQKTLDNW